MANAFPLPKRNSAPRPPGRPVASWASVWDYLEGGHSPREFLDQFPSITREMAVQALEEAKESLLDRIA
jgi:hypothetical protein